VPLETYDAERHHVGLAAEGDAALGFVLAGAYSKGFRREIQSDRVGVHYGSGEGLVNVAGLSSWSQDDFSGGAFQYVWDPKDPAMFAACHNFIPSQFSRSLRTVPPLVEWLGGKRRTTADVPLLVTAFGGYLHAVFGDRFCRWLLTDGTFSQDTTPGAADGTERSWLARDAGVAFHSRQDIISVYSLATFSGWTDTFGPPTGVPGSAIVTGGNADGGRLCVAWDQILWTCDLPDDPAVSPVDGNWTRIGRLPGQWVDSCTYAGLTYILLTGDDMRAQLVAFDGTSILPITDFPYNFVGESLEVYGGRVYVGGSGRDIQTDAPRYAELYEVTGASLRLVRTFAPERWGAGGTQPTSIPDMAVHEGLLFLCIKGQGLLAYDLTSDSFYGAAEFAPTDTTAMATRLCSARENLFSWCSTLANHVGDQGWYRPATSQETISDYYSILETCDFAQSIDRTKRWKQARAMVRFPHASGPVTLSYSTDGGLSWSSYAAGTIENVGYLRLVTWDLTDATESRQIRFRFKVGSSTNVTSFREFLGFTASFRILDSDVVGTAEKEKRAWVMTVGGLDQIEAGDGSTITQDLEAIRQQLWAWARDREHLTFLDLDGSAATVEIDTLDESQPDVLAPVAYRETGAMAAESEGREAFYKLTLVEV